MSRKVKLVADAFIQDVADDSFDAIALPVSHLSPNKSREVVYSPDVASA